MNVISLQSGSNGNCIYVEAGNTRLLFDAGISGKQAQQRLAEHGRDIRRVDALLISHDHRDHSHCLGIYQRKFGLPVVITPDTFATAGKATSLGKVDDLRYFQSGSVIDFGDVIVETIRTPHDASDGVAFVVQHQGKRLGILTDLGHRFAELIALIPSLDAVLLESNYDDQMLEYGNYPGYLKQRIRGPHGHLSNRESAELIGTADGARLQWLCLAHLSAENNTPELALEAHRAVLGHDLPVHVASRYKVSRVMTV